MKYICTVCDFIYDPEIGDPEGGIEPGTQFAEQMAAKARDKQPSS